jgi:meso-butanediol dehydrogenase/(S,S)-butanediol dehydrogenase/diacetyl reductase
VALAEHNITVNGYAPGVVVTPLWEQLDKDLVDIGFKQREGQAYEDIVENELKIKRVSYPDDVKGTAAFLASHDSDYMTGQMIHIDGGWCIQ